MSLVALISERSGAVADAWCRRIAAGYSAEMERLILSRQDRFANPVGYALTEGTRRLLDGLLADAPREELFPALDDVLRVRAVQELSPSDAAGFTLLLKGALREALAGPLAEDPRLYPELLAFEERVDALALLAFDRYMALRERIYDLRARELSARTRRMLDRFRVRFGWDPDAPEEDTDNARQGDGK